MPDLRRRHVILLVVALVLTGVLLNWSHLINAMLPPGSRPAAMTFAAPTLTDAEFDNIAVTLGATRPPAELGHIAHFREAGVRSYEGPSTCLGCHDEVVFTDCEGQRRHEDLMANLTTTAHYRFFTSEHPNVWGFNGESADNFAMGKINRPCPKPGSFAMTAWAELVVTARGDTLSEGCGQCHIGGQAQAPLGEMMPFYRTLAVEREAIDCLICHAALYDMNRKQVVRDANGRLRWGQDRSLRAALTTNTPTTEACLRCHQHNMGGDIHVEEGATEFAPSLVANEGARPRVLHPGSKRGVPFTPDWDVHAAAGVGCLDCHPTEGHRIAKGTRTTTIMANDLPAVDIACTDCHEAPIHGVDETSRALDAHQERLACQTCHIPSLHPDNMTRRDFAETVFDEHEGIHLYNDELKLTGPGEGIAYVWWNGDGTLLGNPIGENPNGAGLYRFYTGEHRWPEFADFDYTRWYDDVMKPLAGIRPSKIHPMKRFNGRQHVDLQNVGPFGGMFVPYNLPAYYRDGDPDAAARLEVAKPMMGMMYGWLFKFYMMDRFMSYMDIDGWDTGAYADVQAGRRVAARWLPQDAMLELSHGIRLEGALNCADCHADNGVMDFTALGYTSAEVAALVAPR